MKINDVLINAGDYSTAKYIEYAVAATTERALPYIQDGLKPVHRRILYAMTDIGIKAKDKPKKSARIVGDVIGKYHPHGDASVYDAMVGMAVDWNMRYPLVSAQGNFGSRDGDSAAAMRYTEAGITSFAEEVLLKEMREGTCDFKNNFDGTTEEVVLMPSKLNNLLLNGSFGIAVGMATNIPSHNIRELTNATMAYIDNNDITVRELMEHLKGPDFATGAQIITSKEKIIEAYEKGHGSLKVRCRWRVEKLPRGQWQIAVYELPPDSSVQKVLKNVEKITNPPTVKDSKGKVKPLKGAALQEKQFLLSILSDASNQSEGDELKLVLEPRSSKQDPEEFMNLLYPRLGLEETFGINLTMVDENRTPKRESIKEYIAQWVRYRKHVLRRRIQYHLDKAQKRIHVLEGRLKVYYDLDKAIEIIRTSDEAKAELIEFFNLTDAQAEDILEIKLRQLANMEKDKLEKELDKLKKEEEKAIKILESETRFINLLKKEIEELTVMFEDERRTLIEEAKEAQAKSSDVILEETVSIIYTKNGWMTLRKGHDVDTSTIALKDSDEIEKVVELKTTDKLAFLASNGRGYSIRPTEVPNGKNFAHVNSLVDVGEHRIIDVFAGLNENKYFFANNSGYGFISSADNLVAKNKAGKHFISMPDDAVVFKPLSFNDEMCRLNVLTTDNRVLSFDISEIKELDKGKGVQLARLAEGALVKEVSISLDTELPLLIDGKKVVYKDAELEAFKCKRGRRGKAVKEGTSLI